jgi:hypothetical protein
MDNAVFDQVLDELFSSLESLEAQTRALTQFLKDKGSVPEEEFAPYLHLAAEASNVRWRAERVRINSLLNSALKNMDDLLTVKIEKVMEEEKKEKPAAEKHPGEREARPSEIGEKNPKPQPSSDSKEPTEHKSDHQASPQSQTLPDQESRSQPSQDRTSPDQSKHVNPAKNSEAA